MRHALVSLRVIVRANFAARLMAVN
jgi:hypothetical protein